MPDGGKDSDESWQSRRQYLKITSAAAAAGLIAGCGGGDPGTDGDGGDTTTTTGDGGDGGGGGGDGGDGGGGGGDGGDGGGSDILDREFVGRLKGIFPSDVQYNPFNPKNNAWQVNEVVFDRLTYRDPSNKYWPFVASSWDVPDEPTEGSTVTINLREDPANLWHNGDEFVAQDLVTYNRLGKAFNYTIWDYISEVSAADEKTVEYTLSGAVNPTILKSIVLDQGVMRVKDSVYRSNLEKITDASSEDAKNSAKQTLQQRSIGTKDVIANGPFVPVEATSKKLFTERFEDYNAPAEVDGLDSPNSVDYDIPNFTKYTFLFGSEDQELPMLKSEKLDGSRAAPHIASSDLPDSYELRPFANDLGESFGFNFNDDIFGKREVRQAMAHIVDRSAVVRSMNPPSRSKERIQLETPDTLTGMASPYAKEWLGDLYDQFPKYNNGQNTEEKLARATELLESVGFTKQNGKWMRPNGEVWTPEFKAPTYWEKSMSPTTNLLKRFGIQAQLTVQEAGTYWGKTLPNGDFGGIGYIWIAQGGSIMIHPWNAYAGELSTEAVVPDGQDGNLRIPREVNVPPVGEPDASNDLTVNIVDLVEQMAKPKPQEEMRDLVVKAAWVFNQLVPNIQLRRHTTQMAVDQVNWQWPEPGSPTDNKLLWQGFGIAHGGWRPNTN